jgi:hypothetical protein
MTHQRNRFSEFEDRAAVQSEKFLAIDLKGDGHDGTLRSSRNLRAGLSIVGDGTELRLLEGRHIQLRCFFRLIVEPQTWRYLLHTISLLKN